MVCGVGIRGLEGLRFEGVVGVMLAEMTVSEVMAMLGERVMTTGALMGVAAGRASAGSATPRVGVRRMLSGPDW